MSNDTIISYAAPAPPHRPSYFLASMPLMIAAIPLIGYLLADLATNSNLGGTLFVFGMLASPLNLLFAIALIILFRRQPLALTLSIVGAAVAAVYTAAVAYVLATGNIC